MQLDHKDTDNGTKATRFCDLVSLIRRKVRTCEWRIASDSHHLYFVTDCGLCAAVARVRNPWMGGCHGFLGHMRGFPVASSRSRSSSRIRRWWWWCLDQKSRAIFIQTRNICGRNIDWVWPAYIIHLNPFYSLILLNLEFAANRFGPHTSIFWNQEWV